MGKGRGVDLRGPWCFSSRCVSAGRSSEFAALVLDSRFSSFARYRTSDRLTTEGDDVGLVYYSVQQGHSHRRIP